MWAHKVASKLIPLSNLERRQCLEAYQQPDVAEQEGKECETRRQFEKLRIRKLLGLED